MLDEYIDEQYNVTTLLNDCIKQDRYSHAYLFVVNKYPNAYKFIYSFIKSICCPNNNNCCNCNICKLIDEKSFSDFKFLESDSLVLKKEQILELQDYFDTKKLYARKRVYMIKNCEKMNISASNTLLKFLEEPEEDIVAILTTDNINQVLDTIKSRCQIIYFNSNSNNSLEQLFSYLSSDIQCTYDDFLNDIQYVIDFSSFSEKNGLYTISYTKKKWHDYFSDRVMFKYALNIMLYFYLDVISYKIGTDVGYFSQYLDDIKKIANCHDIMYYIKKIKIINKYIDLVKYNVNLNMILDRMIIEWNSDIYE